MSCNTLKKNLLYFVMSNREISEQQTPTVIHNWSTLSFQKQFSPCHNPSLDVLCPHEQPTKSGSERRQESPEKRDEHTPYPKSHPSGVQTREEATVKASVHEHSSQQSLVPVEAPSW